MAEITACRSCGAAGLEHVLDLGRTPLADRLVTQAGLAGPEPRYPLAVAFCPACGLVQIRETVPPEVLFCEDYPYFSSFSDALLRHSRANALELIAERGLGPTSLAVELASNDGYLLKNYVEQGIPVLDEASPMPAGEEIGKQSGTSATHMQVAGGRGGETGSDGHGNPGTDGEGGHSSKSPGGGGFEGGSGGVWRGCRPQGCGRQAYREVFTTAPARRHPTRNKRGP